jgi:pyruvate ferredoxin oxidoreductase delta subunit
MQKEGKKVGLIKLRSYIPFPVKDFQSAPKEEKMDLNVGGYGVLKDVSSWRVFTPEIDQEKCIGCKSCWIFCPETAIQWDEATKKPSIEYRKCKGCGVCVNECPVKAIEMVRVEA